MKTTASGLICLLLLNSTVVFSAPQANVTPLKNNAAHLATYQAEKEKLDQALIKQAIAGEIDDHQMSLMVIFLLILAGIFYHRSIELERKRTSHYLQKIETRYRNTFEFAPIGILNISLQGRFLEVNQTTCALLGYKREELLTMSVLDVTPPHEKSYCK